MYDLIFIFTMNTTCFAFLQYRKGSNNSAFAFAVLIANMYNKIK